MKKILLIAISLVFLLSSCEKDESTVNDTDNSTGTTLNVSPSSISIGKSAGASYISVTSNTDWTVYVNNSGSSVSGLDVSPLSGTNDGTVKVKYDGVTTTYYSGENAVIVFSYYFHGVRQSKTVGITRKGNYP